MLEFKNLRDIKPKAEAFENKIQAWMANVPNNIIAEFDELDNEARELSNEIAEAIYQDTKHVNNRDTIFSIFGNKGFDYNHLKTINSFIKEDHGSIN